MNIAFKRRVPVAANCIITVDTPTITDDGVDAATVTVAVRDDLNRPVVRYPASLVTVASSGTGNTLVQPLGFTNASGEVTATVRATVAEAKTLSATVGGSAVTDTAALTVEEAVSGATLLFFDDFSSGDLTHTEGGVAWGDQAFTEVSTDIARTGTHSLKFRQGENGDTGEARFTLPDLDELFMEFYLYMPDGTESPSLGPKHIITGTGNDKFFRVWGDTYAAPPELGSSVWGDGGGTDGGMNTEYMYNPGGGEAIWGMGEGPGGEARVPCYTDAYRGRWVRVRIQAKIATTANNDGIFRVWFDDTLIQDRADLACYPGAAAELPWRNGYLLGWANNGFEPGQVTYIADVKVTTGGFAEASQPSFEFTADFGTETGTTDAAFRDTSQPVPWTSIVGTNPNCEVIASTGLDFPTTNVLHIVTNWNGSGSSSKIPRLTGELAVPANGESKYYRWYLRFAVPESLSTWGFPHPVQDGPDGGNYNWELETRRGSTGLLVSPMISVANNVSPNNRWAALDSLSVNETYRFEVRFHRLDETTYNIHARVYDSGGTLVLSDADFLNATGTGVASLADLPVLSIADATQLANFQCGTNGAFQGTVEADHPVTFCYQSGFAVSTQDWCGAYVSGEGST